MLVSKQEYDRNAVKDYSALAGFRVILSGETMHSQ